MPLNLSKEEVAKLDEEQLDAYARVHLDSVRVRRELVDRASGRNRSFVVPIVTCVLGIAALVWFPGFLRDPVVIVLLAIALLFGYHRSTNRRIDALVRLLDLDRVPEGQTAEPVVAPDRPLEPPIKSASSARGPED